MSGCDLRLIGADGVDITPVLSPDVCDRCGNWTCSANRFRANGRVIAVLCPNCTSYVVEELGRWLLAAQADRPGGG